MHNINFTVRVQFNSKSPHFSFSANIPSKTKKLLGKWKQFFYVSKSVNVNATTANLDEPSFLSTVIKVIALHEFFMLAHRIQGRIDSD